ncbi:MAG: PQQ-dependent sugar dehydrogenase [Bacteroidota bacterium]|nr:PQQ-dependent sugar dehydrogenase [Bacteroidota bacterium]
MKNIFPIFFFAALLTLNAKKITAQKLAVNPYVNGFTLPIDLKNCGDDRLFVAERPGRIRVVNADGTLRPAPFLDITAKVSSYTNGEEGFLGFAFSPNYKTDGKFFVDYTANIAGLLTTVIEQYTVSASDSNVANTTSLRIISQTQPFSNHNGGNLMFGKDGYLYINLGDGGSAGDPQGNGQNKNTFLAKILRIDISNSSVRQPYRNPPTNPFVGQSGVKPEIWAYGVRNPWRSSFDRITGDLWIADVGQNAVEEIDFQNANAAGGRNYGWNIMEGTACYNPPSGCNQTGLTLPIYDYTHAVGHSVTGGYVYRSAQSKSLWGVYLFADYVSKWIDGITQSNGTLAGMVTRYITNAQATGNPVSFGQDRLGDLYILFNNDGTVYRLEDTSYQRRPKAYFTSIDQGNGSFLFQGLQGRNFTYQWLRNNIPVPAATDPDYIPSGSGSYQLVVTNMLDSSDTSDVFFFSALPISLTSFTAQKLSGNDIVKLQWNTAFEQNIKGYAILRKENNQQSFSKIGFVESKSLNTSSAAEFSYAFFDSSITNNSKLFYRLEIVNADGSSSFSAIRTITYSDLKNNFVISPNPAKGQVQILLGNYSSPAIMMLYDNSGKKIKEQKLTQQSNTIDLTGLSGIYIVQLSDNNGTNITRKKLVVE